MYFEIMGKPQGKARARTGYNPRVGKVTSCTTEKTVLYENLIKLEFMRQCGKQNYIGKTPLAVEIVAVYPIAKSSTKAFKAQAAANLIRPTVKPDADNVAKVVCDALNGIAYTDDTQIVQLTVSKVYGDHPRVTVDIVEIIDGRA